MGGRITVKYCGSPVEIGARRVRAGALLVVVFSMIGCTAKRLVLVPAPNATLAARPNSAEGSSQGVSVLLQADAWDGYPRTLDRNLIPIKVTIQNSSDHDVAIRYEDFVLIASGDRRYSGIPPDQIKGFSREALQPYWAYSEAEKLVAVQQLPTESMLQQAMSEGVVVRGTETSGFLYFPRPSKLPNEITFNVILVDANTKQRFADIVVPLVLKVLPRSDTYSPL
jgi:hypothetical protein